MLAHLPLAACRLPLAACPPCTLHCTPACATAICTVLHFGCYASLLYIFLFIYQCIPLATSNSRQRYSHLAGASYFVHPLVFTGLNGGIRSRESCRWYAKQYHFTYTQQAPSGLCYVKQPTLYAKQTFRIFRTPFKPVKLCVGKAAQCRRAYFIRLEWFSIHFPYCRPLFETHAC
jgi:hypothetical protein